MITEQAAATADLKDTAARRRRNAANRGSACLPLLLIGVAIGFTSMSCQSHESDANLASPEASQSSNAESMSAHPIGLESQEQSDSVAPGAVVQPTKEAGRRADGASWPTPNTPADEGANRESQQESADHAQQGDRVEIEALPGAAEQIEWPGVSINLAGRFVDVKGEVVLDAAWLEQIVCLPGTRTHESIVVAFAQPSHVHAALLAIGLEAGQPGRWVPADDPEARGVDYVAEPPEGDEVRVSFVYTEEPGDEIEVAAQEWVHDAETGAQLPDRPWIFGGSKMVENYDGRTVYAADLTGSLVGLVTFGDETLGWKNVIPDRVAYEPPEWEADTEAIPPIGTPVTIRLRPADE